MSKSPSNKNTEPAEKTASKPNSKFQFSELTKNERFQKAIGLLSILFSVYLLVAFVSFIFTWQADFDKVNDSWMALLFNPDILVDNWLGKMGAIISYQFIYKWFGISSFIFVLLFFLFGFKVVFKVSLLPIRKTVRRSFFILVWTSMTLGVLFDESLHFLGGGFGYLVNLWLESTIGAFGAVFFVFFGLMAFIIVNYNLKMSQFIDLFSAKKEEESLLKFPAQSMEASIPSIHLEDLLPPQNTMKKVELEPETTHVIETEIEDYEVEEIEEEEFEDAADETIELKPETPKSKELESLDFEVEVYKPEEQVFPAATQIPSSIEAEEIEKPKIETVDEGVEFVIEENNENDQVTSASSLVEQFGEYDPKLDLARFQMPPIEMLNDYGHNEINVNREELEANKKRIVETLNNYNIQIDKIKATVGPTVTLYEIVPAPGVRISKIKNLEDDIALSLSALGIRIIAPIPGKGTIGIEVPNQKPEMVSMRSIILSQKFQNSDFELPVALGRTIQNESFVADLAKMPHLLMAGATGQGKSVGLNAILVSLLYKKHPSQIKFVLVDPKKVELTLFNKIERHYLAKLPDSVDAIITDNSKVIDTLNSLCIEMDNRYEILKDALCRNIKEYNTKFIARKLNPENGHRYLPYIVLVVDEFADLIMTAGKEVETPIARLAQLARAIGIHLIIATQRPSVNIITGTIKANFPSRIAFRVTSKIDSRTILDSGGAEQLIGRGDMLLATGSELIRLQCAFVDTPEVENICDFIGGQQGYPDAYLLPEFIGEHNESNKESFEDMDRDVLFNEAAKLIVIHQQGSASLLQRRLKLGYNRAGRLIDQLEAAGIVGSFEGSKSRQVLITDEVSLEQYLKEKLG